jgi:hypothetical protein
MKHKDKFDLVEHQVNFSKLILTPLFEDQGELVPNRRAFPEYMREVTVAGLNANLGLDTYNRNYWYKLLTTLQSSFPLVSKVMGLWEFNKLSLKHFGSTNFSSRDLGEFPKSYFKFVKDEIASLYDGNLRDALLQAFTLDEAWYNLFRCPWEVDEGFAGVPSEGSIFFLRDQFYILRDSYHLWERRQDLLDDWDSSIKSKQAFDGLLKKGLEKSGDEFYILKSNQMTLEKFSISTMEARLLKSLNGKSLAEGILEFSQSLSSTEVQVAQANLQNWIKQSLERKMWRIVSPGI